MIVCSMFLTFPRTVSSRCASDNAGQPTRCAVSALFAYEQGPESVAEAGSASINAEAICGAHVIYDCLERLVDSESLADALANVDNLDEPELFEALDKPAYYPLRVANHFGMPCHIKQGLPVACLILKHTSDFKSAVRDNVRCGGDSCGRSVAVGAVATLVVCVPYAMRTKLDQIN